MSSSKNALVIGVSEYEHINKLSHTVNDAEDMAATLRKLGFAVMLETNPTLTELEDALENFASSIEYNKDIALFYYSGHGIQVDGKNYLIPKNAELDREIRIKKQTIDLEEVIQSVSVARNELNIFILDACRDNPFAGKFKSVNRGLAEIKKMPPSTYFAYAAAAGQTAGDGVEGARNGIFTESFLKILEEHSSEEIDMIFRKTRSSVLKKTKNAQEPWTNHNLSERYYLIEPKAEIAKPEIKEPEPIKNRDREYLDLLRAVYADGVVVDSERKLLRKKQVELGLTDERALELEEQIKIECVDVIKEYEGKSKKENENKYKDFLQRLYDDGMITDKDRKTLSDKKKEFGVSDETADSIESEIKGGFVERLQRKLEKERQSKESGKEKTKESQDESSVVGSRHESTSQERDVGISNDKVETHGETSSANKKILIVTVAILLLSVVGWFGYQKFQTGKQDSTKKVTNPPVLEKSLTNSIGMEFVAIPAGEFLMGCTGEIAPDGKIKYTDTECFQAEKPLHKVKITEPFYMGKYEVTKGEFQKFVSEKNYKTEAEKEGGCEIWNGSDWTKSKESNWKKVGFTQTEKNPVVCISWNDAKAFINWLNEKEGKNYRLPTEAEWEYAARGSTSLVDQATTKYYWGNIIDKEYLWYNENSDNKTHAVGEKKPNNFGLYDMSGNVWEWTEDWYADNSYSSIETIDPKGAKSGAYRVIRGCSWGNFAVNCRSSYRLSNTPDNRHSFMGFRVVVLP